MAGMSLQPCLGVVRASVIEMPMRQSLAGLLQSDLSEKKPCERLQLQP